MDARQKRVADNEALWREVNRSIDHTVDDRVTQGSEPIGYVCECGDPECNDVVFLHREEFSAVREHPARFFLTPGHEDLHTERVVEQHDGYFVVEKIGDASDHVAKRDDSLSSPDANGA